MKQFFLAICIVLVCSSILYAKDFWLMSPSEIDDSLAGLAVKYPDFEDRAAIIANMRIGSPYKLGPLGENDARGPIFTVKYVDCTVFVLTTLALADKCSYSGAADMMRYLNYYNPPRKGFKPVSYENRIHFTYDRLHSCPFFEDITSLVFPSKNLAKAEVILNGKADGTELLPISWNKKATAEYILISDLNESVLQKLPKIAGVGFVRKKNFEIGTIIAHEGFIIDGRYIVHADSVAGKVVKADFLDYCGKNDDYFDGVVLSRFNFKE